MSTNKHTQVVDFSNPNADKIISASTQASISNNKQSSSVDWLISQLQKSKDWHRVLNEISQMSSAKVDIIAEAKAMHKEETTDFANKSIKMALCEDIQNPFDLDEIYNETFGGRQ